MAKLLWCVVNFEKCESNTRIYELAKKSYMTVIREIVPVCCFHLYREFSDGMTSHSFPQVIPEISYWGHMDGAVQ